jgi:hypothetical protein
VRRFSVAAFRRRDLTDAEPVLERRRIAPIPRQRTSDLFSKGDYSRDLRLEKWGSGVSFHGSLSRSGSAAGHKRTWRRVNQMSALLPKGTFASVGGRPTEWPDTDGASRANRNRIVVENFSKLGLALFVFLIPEVSIRAESAPCQPVTYEHSEYTVCEVDLRRQSVRLFWKKPDGYPYEYLSSLPRSLGDHSRHLLFATNGGMYQPDNSPVGLYVERVGSWRVPTRTPVPVTST